MRALVVIAVTVGLFGHLDCLHLLELVVDVVLAREVTLASHKERSQVTLVKSGVPANQTTISPSVELLDHFSLLRLNHSIVKVRNLIGMLDQVVV
jgi:hypothetical protein